MLWWTTKKFQHKIFVRNDQQPNILKLPIKDNVQDNLKLVKRQFEREAKLNLGRHLSKKIQINKLIEIFGKLADEELFTMSNHNHLLIKMLPC